LRCSAQSRATIFPTRVEPVKLTRRGDQILDDQAGVLRRIGDEVDDTLWQLRIGECLDNQPVRRRAYFRALQNDGIAARERKRNGPHAEDDRRVPRCDAEHHARRLTYAQRQAARDVRRNDFPADLSRQCGSFTQRVDTKMHVETRPDFRCARFRHHCRDEAIGFGFERQRRIPQKGAACIRAQCRPALESLRGGMHGRLRIGKRGRGRDRGHFAVQRTPALEGCAICGGNMVPVNEQQSSIHSSVP
jgi:hypothetical protein